MHPLVEAQALGFTAADTGACLLADVSLRVPVARRVALTGPSGSGKTTLAWHLAGLHRRALYGDTVGRLRFDGVDGLPGAPAGFAGMAMQNPETQLFADTPGAEITQALLARQPAAADLDGERDRLLAAWGLTAAATRPLAALSHGMKQRLSIAAMLALRPRLLILDEPTSYLDAAAADALFAQLRLAQTEHGLTVIVVEHDVERVCRWADDIYVMDNGRLTPAPRGRPRAPAIPHAAPVTGQRQGDVVLRLDQLTFAYAGGAPLFRDFSWQLWRGEIVAVIGPNGTGKTTLLKLCKGLLKPAAGQVEVPGEVRPLMAAVGLVFQNPDDTLFAATAAADCGYWPEQQGLPPATCRERAHAALDAVSLPGLGERFPLTLSYGEKRRLGLAGVLAGRPVLLCLDEPTVGLDAGNLARLAATVRAFAAQGGAVLLATHDTVFADAVATRRLELLPVTAEEEGSGGPSVPVGTGTSVSRTASAPSGGVGLLLFLCISLHATLQPSAWWLGGLLAGLLVWLWHSGLPLAVIRLPLLALVWGLPPSLLIFGLSARETAGDWPSAWAVGAAGALVFNLRLAVLVMANLLLVRQAAMPELVAVLQRLRIPAAAVLFLTAVVRFMPIAVSECRRILDTQRCRGFHRRRLLGPHRWLPLMVPLLVAHLRVAHDLALALEVRRVSDTAKHPPAPRQPAPGRRRLDAGVALLALLLLLAAILATP